VLVTIDAAKRACQFGDEDGDGIVFGFQGARCRVLGVKIGIIDVGWWMLNYC